eukprot:scaffold88735_cov28-Tisochrysis_lutea.AAC.5
MRMRAVLSWTTSSASSARIAASADSVSAMTPQATASLHALSVISESASVSSSLGGSASRFRREAHRCALRACRVGKSKLAA